MHSIIDLFFDMLFFRQNPRGAVFVWICGTIFAVVLMVLGAGQRGH